MTNNESRLHLLEELRISPQSIQRVSEIVDRIVGIQGEKWQDRNITQTGSSTFNVLYQLVVDNADQKGYCIECGTYLGGATAVMGMALRDIGEPKPLFTVDIYNPQEPYLPDEYKKDWNLCKAKMAESHTIARHVFNELGLGKHICAVTYDDASFMQICNFPLCFAFIDSNHSYDHTQKLMNLSLERMMIGGWLAIHDYFPYNDGWPVIPAVNNFIDNTAYKLKPYKGCEGLICLQLIEK